MPELRVVKPGMPVLPEVQAEMSGALMKTGKCGRPAAFWPALGLGISASMPRWVSTDI